MQVKDVMTTGVKWINPNTTVMDAAEMMRKHDCGALPVGDGDRLVGMVTDRDMVIRGLAEHLDPSRTTVRDIMTKKVLYCFNDQPTDDVAKNMAQQKIRRLPVVDRKKRLVGMLSLGDLAARGAKTAAGESLEHISKKA